MRARSRLSAGCILCLAALAALTLELASSLSVGAVWHSAEGPLVNVSCGTVRGVYIDMPNGTVIAGFRGIPFANPPARWQPPAAFGSVCGTPDAPYDGTAERSMCVQPDNSGSEDCLFVNVYTTISAPTNSSLPILAYIHGGGLMWGTSNGMDFTKFMAANPAGSVVVTIAYRLNIFGFLAVSELSNEQQGASGNYGLMDLQLGLQWVQANIAQFGGDPQRVTVAGQSSGGTAIFALLASPGSRGLFSRAISLSGSPNISLSLAAAEAQNSGILGAAGCGSAPSPSARLSCMRAAPIATLTAAIPSSWNTPGMWNLPTNPNGMNYAGLPVVEGRVLTWFFEEALRTGLVDVPLMFGNVGYEPDGGPEQVVKGYSQSQWTDFVSKRMAAFGSAAVTKLLGLYANDSATDPQKAYDAIVSDYGLTCATVKLMHSAQGPGGAYRSNIYVFVNNWGPAVPIATLDPNYFIDYAFHTWDLTNVLASYDLYTPQPSDLQHSAYLMEWWHQFMANGSLDASTGWLPVASSPQWPEVASLFVIAPEGPQLVPGYRADQCAFMDSVGIDERFWWCD